MPPPNNAGQTNSNIPLFDAQQWWEQLDEAWRKLFLNQFSIATAAEAGRAAAITSIHIDGGSEITQLAPLASLQYLEAFVCDSPRIADLSPLAGLHRLNRIKCTGQALRNLSPLVNLKGLHTLQLAGSGVQDLAPLSGLILLDVVDLGDTRVDDISPLANCRGLRWLSLRNTAVTTINPLQTCGALYELNVSGCRIIDFRALRSLPRLGILLASRTPLSSLQPLERCHELHILVIEDTLVRFEELLRFLNALWQKRVGKEVAASFSIRSNFHRTPDAFAQALAAVDFPVEGLEDLLCKWVNEQLTAALKMKGYAATVNQLIRSFFSLRLQSIDPGVREELAANILVPIVDRRLDSVLEQLFFERFLVKPVKLPRLNYNLACYYASRGHKAALMEYTWQAMAGGYPAYKFRRDADFEDWQEDVDFLDLLNKPPLPDPNEHPVEWLHLLPESLQDVLTFHLKDESADGIRELLQRPGLELFYDDPVRLDPLQHIIGLKALSLVAWDPPSGDTPALSLEPLAGLQQLESLLIKNLKISHVEALFGLKKLREIDWKGIGKAEAAMIRRHMPWCMIV